MFSLFKGEYENDLGGDGVSGMNARQWACGCQLFGEAVAWKLADGGDGGMGGACAPPHPHPTGG